jgi:hypothetical protein
MRWTERQRAMLREIGPRLWFRESETGAGIEGQGDVAVVVTGETAIVRRSSMAAGAAQESATLPAAPASTLPRSPSLETAPSRSEPAAHIGDSLSAAEWLIVGGPFESPDDGTRAAIEAEQEQLLANMLRAIGVSGSAAATSGRACHIRLGAPGADDLALAGERVRPRCVLALGRAAAMALLDIDEPLGRLRGRAHAWRGIPVVVTFSLAYLLRNPGEKAKAWADLCLAVSAFDAHAV